MSNTYKSACQTFQKTCLKITVGSAVVLSSLILPQMATAATIESFEVSGEIRNNSTSNPIFSGANFTGTFDLDLDARYISDIGTAMYDLTSWEISFTANSGESFDFSQGETGDRAYLYLQPGYSFLPGYDMLTINFTEDNESSADSFLQFAFNTDYDITTNTTLTELLNADPQMGTFDGFRSGTVSNLQNATGGTSTLESALFAPASNEEVISPVPEASTLAMLGLGGLMVFGLARRNRKTPSAQTA